MTRSIQEQLAEEIKERFPDAQVKKIDKDNFLDIHIPSIHNKKATHLFFNTVKGNIKLGFYCRDDDFLGKIASDLENIEFYSQGIRLAGNPVFNTINDAVSGAVELLQSISKSTPQIPESAALTDNDKLMEALDKIKASGKKEKFTIIKYLDSLDIQEEFYSCKIGKNQIDLKLTQKSMDSFWKVGLKRDDLIDELEIYSEDTDLDNSFQLDWKFSHPGTQDNEVEIAVIYFDETAKYPANCYQEGDRQLGLDPYSIFELYNPERYDEETIEYGRIAFFEIMKADESLLKIDRNFEIAFDNVEDYIDQEEDTRNFTLFDDTEEESIPINASTIPQMLKAIDSNKEISHFKIIAYTKEYSDLMFGLEFKINDSKIEIARTNWFNDSYWTWEIQREDLIEGLTNYLENGDVEELINSHIDADAEYEFNGAGFLDNGFNYEVTDIQPELVEIPEEFQDGDGDLDVLAVTNDLLPDDEYQFDRNIGSISSYQVIINDQIFEVKVEPKTDNDAENEQEEEEFDVNNLEESEYDSAQESLPNDAVSLVKCVSILGYYFFSMDDSAIFRDDFEAAIYKLFQPANFSNTENDIVREVMEYFDEGCFLSKCYMQGRRAAETECQNYEYVRDYIESLHLYIKDLDYYVNDLTFLKKYLETFIELGNMLPSETPAGKEIRVQDRYLVVHIALTAWFNIDEEELEIEKILEKVKYNLPHGNLLKYSLNAKHLTYIEKASLFIYNLILLSEDGLEIKKPDIYRAKMLISEFFGFDEYVQDLEIKGSLNNSNEDDLGKIIGGFDNNFCFEAMHFFNCRYNIDEFRKYCMDLFVGSYEVINEEYNAYIEDSIDEANFDAEELREEKIMDQFYKTVNGEDY